MQRHYKGSGAWRRWAAARCSRPPARPGRRKRPRRARVRAWTPSARGELRVGVLQNAPWLIQDVSGKTGEAWSGPAWLLAREYARRLGVKLTPVPVSHETKVPVLAANQVDMTISPLAETPERLKVVDFVLYSATSVCMFGRAGNDKLAQVRSVDDLNRPGITIAYFTGGAEEAWVKQRFPMPRCAPSPIPAPPRRSRKSWRAADAAPINRVPWVGLKRKVPGLQVFPAEANCQQSTERLRRWGWPSTRGRTPTLPGCGRLRFR